MKAKFDKAKQYLKSKGICFSTRITAGKIAKHMEGYADEVSRERAIDFAGFYYDSVAEDPTPKEITPEILYNEFTHKQEEQQ